MKAIKVMLNGKVVCCAGLPKAGNLTAVISMVNNSTGQGNENQWWFADVGSLSVESGDNCYLKFFGKRLKKSDTISFRVVEVEKSSHPKSKRVEKESERLKHKKKYFKELAKELEGNK